MIAPDGLKIIYYSTALFIVLIVLTWYFPNLFLQILTTIAAIIFVFNFYFFRDPERKIPEGENLILSPADGTIIKIEDSNEPMYFKGKAKKISIFLSVFNVHVNRIPQSGKVDYFKYNPGKFLIAFDDKASDDNEQTVIGIATNKGKILFKQIAGIIARRIICRVKEGDVVTAGERFGLIRYGSRVDMFFPENVVLKVKLKDKVVGGETIIGEFE